MGTVLYAVPGTDVAKEAVLDAQIPQTATVERKKGEHYRFVKMVFTH